MATISDVMSPQHRPMRPASGWWVRARLAVDACLAVAGGGLIWALASRSLLLPALAVATCLLAASAATVTVHRRPQPSMSIAIACGSLVVAVLVSTPRLWAANETAAACFVLISSVGIGLASVDASEVNRATPPILLLAAIALGPLWSLAGGDGTVELATAWRCLAVVAAAAMWTARRDRRASASLAAIVVAALAGAPGVGLQGIEHVAFAMVGLVCFRHTLRGDSFPVGVSTAPEPSDAGSLRRGLALGAGLAVAAWITTVVGAPNAAAVLLTGGILATLVSVVPNVTARWAGQRRVRSLERIAVEMSTRAQMDSLTALPNRAALEGRLAEEVERAIRYRQPLALCFVDIDHFKSVNDTSGHGTGDEVLAAVARTLRSTARTIDFVARLGGEEFVVIAPGTWSSDGVVLADRLRAAVSLTRVPGTGQDITISVGVAGVPEHAADGESLLRRADEALYAAKRSGRDATRLATGSGFTARG